MKEEEILDLDNPEAEILAKQMLKHGRETVGRIIKSKLRLMTIKELTFHLITLGIVLPYAYLLFTGTITNETYDTLAKLIIGAYIANILSKK